jgi:hypothetical protein
MARHDGFEEVVCLGSLGLGHLVGSPLHLDEDDA